MKDTSRNGTARQLLVVIDMMRRGWHVFEAVCGGSPLDYIVLKDSVILRMEVTTGRRQVDGSITIPQKDKNRFDLLAVVDGDDDSITYVPSLDPESVWVLCESSKSGYAVRLRKL